MSYFYQSHDGDAEIMVPLPRTKSYQDSLSKPGVGPNILHLLLRILPP